jgi:hypothetical protein
VLTAIFRKWTKTKKPSVSSYGSVYILFKLIKVVTSQCFSPLLAIERTNTSFCFFSLLLSRIHSTHSANKLFCYPTSPLSQLGFRVSSANISSGWYSQIHIYLFPFPRTEESLFLRPSVWNTERPVLSPS